MVQSNTTVNEEDRFSVSLLAFWVKGSITVDDAFIHVDMPNTILFGLLPAGKAKDSSPLSGVTNLFTSKSYKLGSLLLGIILVVLGVISFTESFLVGLVLAVIGVAIFGSGIKTALQYERSGITKVVEFPFFEANHVDELEQKITDKIRAYQDDRNGRMNTEKRMYQAQQQTEQIVNAVSGNGNMGSNAGNSSNGQFCPNCGAMVTAGAHFCNHCGTKIG